MHFDPATRKRRRHHARHLETFYVPAGHTPANAADTEYVRFSPAEDLAVVSETIKRNVAALQAQTG